MKDKQKEPLHKKAVSNALQIPYDALSGGITQIELLGNREAVVEGSEGILEYNDTLIRIALRNLKVTFTGMDLTIKSLGSESVIISGQILGLEFTT